MWLLSFTLLHAAPRVVYDPGLERAQGVNRLWLDAAACTAQSPCVVALHGAIRLVPDTSPPPASEPPDPWGAPSPQVGSSENPWMLQEDLLPPSPEPRPEPYTLDIWYLRGNNLRPVQLFPYAADQRRGAVWLAVHRSRNDAVLNFDELIERPAEPPVIYFYGINLRYPLEQTDLIYVEVGEPGEIPERYYFRYWDRGLQYSFNLSTLFPASTLADPAVQEALDASNVNAALSIELFVHLRPDQDHPGPFYVLSGIHPTLLIGALSGFRLENGEMVKTSDAFVGAGLTAFRFASAGVAVTLFDPFGGQFPYAAIHVDEALRLVAELSKNPSRRWEQYLARERPRAP